MLKKVLPQKNLDYRRGLGLSREKGNRQIHGLESRIRAEQLKRWRSDMLCRSMLLGWSMLLRWSLFLWLILWSRLRSLVTEATEVSPEHML